MSSAKLFVPKARLTKHVRTPGGERISDAVASASVGLANMRGAILDDLRDTVDCAQALLAPSVDLRPEQIHELYLVSRPIGGASLCGLPGIDRVLTSWAALLDLMKVHARWEREPVQLHMNSLKLFLAQPDLGSDPDGPIGVGLQQVVEGYRARCS